MAIDGINNVVEFLELLEDDEIEGVEFLEMRACDEGCAGGILCPGNRFLTVEKLKNRADFCQKKIENTGKTPAKKLRSYDDYLIQNAGRQNQRKVDCCLPMSGRSNEQNEAYV